MDIPYGLTVRGLLKHHDKILLLKRHSKSKTNPNRWELPGGKVDKGEDFDKALIREFIEETNLKIEIGDLLDAVQEDFPHKRTIVLIMNVKSESYDVKISDEHVDYIWVTFNELKDLNISGWFENLLIKRNNVL